jgi:enterochelin esterase family protein
VAPGQLSEPLVIRTRALGYDVQYQVYTPAGYETLQDLPVVYATDGQDYAHPDMGALPAVLDNLIVGGVIRPVMAVFIDMRDPLTGGNRRETLLVANDRFQQFLVDELVPAIDQAYRTQAAPDGRVILGTSLGGLHAAYSGLHHSDVFGMAAIYSPYFRAWPAVMAGYTRAERLPLKVFMMQGTYDFDVENTRQLHNALQEKGYPVLFLETADGHFWGNWRGVMDDMLRFFFGTWETSPVSSHVSVIHSTFVQPPLAYHPLAKFQHRNDRHSQNTDDQPVHQRQ